MRWNPISWFPFSQEGRKTLIYLVIAGCGPALTIVIIWALTVIRDFKDATAEAKLASFSELAMMLGYNSIIITIALSCFVSIRAFNIDLKNGTMSTQSKDDEEANQ